MRRLFLVGAAVIVAIGSGLALAGVATAASPAPVVLLVCNGSTVPCPAGAGPYYGTVQGAVDAARAGDGS